MIMIVRNPGCCDDTTCFGFQVLNVHHRHEVFHDEYGRQVSTINPVVKAEIVYQLEFWDDETLGT